MAFIVYTPEFREKQRQRSIGRQKLKLVKGRV